MRYRYTFIIALLSVVIMAYHGQCQSQTYFHFGVQEGLPSSETYDVFQDSNGFIWISTDNGVVKFDGYKPIVFNATNGLPDPVVFETMEDHNGKLWFRTLSGKIGYYENEAITPYPFNKSLAKACELQYLNSMSFDASGTLWFISNGQVGSINSAGVMTIDPISQNHFYFKTIENRGVIGASNIIGKINSILIDGKEFQVELSRSFLDAKTSHPVMRWVNWRGNLYFNINNNVFKYDGQKVTRVLAGPSAIISLSKDRDDNIWVGYFGGGASRFSSEAFTEEWSPAILQKKSVSKVLQDHEGGLWMSTLENGVYYFPSTNINHYTLSTDSKVKTVFSNQTSVLIGATDGALFEFDPKTKQSRKLKVYKRAVLSIYENITTRWVSMSSGTYIYDLKSGNLKNLVTHSNFVDFSADDNGFVYAVDAMGVSKFDENGNFLWRKSKRSPYRAILCVDTLLVIGLHTGLNIYDLDFNLIKTPEISKNYKITDLFALNDSTIIVATVGNGFYVTDNTFTTFTEHTLPAKNIYSIIEVDSTLWMGTEKGLLKINKQSISSPTLNYDFITQQSGLQSNQVILLAKTSTGEVLPFYDNSFSVIPSVNHRYSNKFPQLYISSIQINSKPRELTTSILLPYDSNNIQLNFGFISFNNQEIQIRYRLKDKDPWLYTTDRSINLFSLSPDEYSPALQYTADNTTWLDVPLPKININPPWWKNIFFQITLFSLIFIIAITLLYNQIVIYRERNEKMELMNKHQKMLIKTELDTLERERTRIARDLHDSISPTIIAANLLLKNSIRKNEPIKIELVENEFHTALQELKSMVYDLEPPELSRFGLFTGLKNYVERISEASQLQIILNCTGTDLQDSKLTRMVFRILQELITNSLKHSGADCININLQSLAVNFIIEYRDNGRGFVKSEKQNGLGLHNIESRVLTQNGKIFFNSDDFGVYYKIELPITNT